jgi:tetratricopeptide (TPR) repeat protein
MKKLITAVLFLLITASTYAQEATEGNQAPEGQNAFVGHHSRTYAIATKYGDTDMAKTALYNMLAAYPGNDSLLYSLSYLYFQSQQYASAVLSSQDILARNPEHLGALELSGAGYESLGLKDKSLAAYETLYLKSTDYQTLYKIAFLQFDMERLKECMTNLDILLTKTESDSLKVFYTTGENEQKEYPIRVSLYNLKGLVSKKYGDKESAKKHFEQALAIAPDFALAKQNIEELDKK